MKEWKKNVYCFHSFFPTTHSPAPLHIKPAAVHNEFVEGFFCCYFCSLSGSKLDKCTLLPLDHCYCPDLTKLIEVIPEEETF